MQTALHRPNSRRTGWLVPVQAAGISEVTVHREKETYLCVIPQVPQVYYYYFTVENFQGSKEKKNKRISAMVISLSRGGEVASFERIFINQRKIIGLETQSTC